MTLQSLAVRGNLQLVRDDRRRFPGLLVQGDTLHILLEDLEEEAPDSNAAGTLRSWVATYEEMIATHGLQLPYRR